MTPEEARQYSLHSLKATVLSWSRQCNIPEDMRAEQGHHKHGSARASVRLYGRDDVWGAVRLQRVLHEQLRSGWRPMAAQARGGQEPAQERNVVLSCSAVHVQSPSKHSAPTDEAEMRPAPSRSPSPSPCSSSSSRSSTTDGTASENGDRSQMTILSNKLTLVSHVACLAHAQGTAGKCVKLRGQHWRPACGARCMDPHAYAVGHSIPEGYESCAKKGCAQILAPQSE